MLELIILSAAYYEHLNINCVDYARKKKEKKKQELFTSAKLTLHTI
jgi:hypothetical protein